MPDSDHTEGGPAPWGGVSELAPSPRHCCGPPRRSLRPECRRHCRHGDPGLEVPPLARRSCLGFPCRGPLHSRSICVPGPRAVPQSGVDTGRQHRGSEQPSRPPKVTPRFPGPPNPSPGPPQPPGPHPPAPSPPDPPGLALQAPQAGRTSCFQTQQKTLMRQNAAAPFTAGSPEAGEAGRALGTGRPVTSTARTTPPQAPLSRPSGRRGQLCRQPRGAMGRGGAGEGRQAQSPHPGPHHWVHSRCRFQQGGGLGGGGRPVWCPLWASMAPLSQGQPGPRTRTRPLGDPRLEEERAGRADCASLGVERPPPTRGPGRPEPGHTPDTRVHRCRRHTCAPRTHTCSLRAQIRTRRHATADATRIEHTHATTYIAHADTLLQTCACPLYTRALPAQARRHMCKHARLLWTRRHMRQPTTHTHTHTHMRVYHTRTRAPPGSPGPSRVTDKNTQLHAATRSYTQLHAVTCADRFCSPVRLPGTPAAPRT